MIPCLSNFSADFGDFVSNVENVQNVGVERVYPNPNTGQFTIDLVSDKEGDVSIELLDLGGKLEI